jgi:hypothetical protein
MKVELVPAYILANDAGISAANGANLWPVVVPKGQRPNTYIVWRVVSNVMRQTIDAGQSFKAWRARIEITVGAGDYLSLKNLVQAVRTAMNLQRGIINSVQVDLIMLALEGAEYYDDGSQVFVQTLDFYISYHE